MTDYFKVGQWNIRGWTSGSLFHNNLNKIKTIESILVDLRIDILLISEWLIAKRNWIIPNSADANFKKIKKINLMLNKYDFIANSTCTAIMISKHLNYRKKWLYFNKDQKNKKKIKNNKNNTTGNKVNNKNIIFSKKKIRSPKFSRYNQIHFSGSRI